MNNSNKIIIACSGTGGHLYPGIALARELYERGYDIYFVLRRGDFGKEVLTNEGFHCLTIPIIGMPRVISFRIFMFILLLPASIVYSIYILLKVNPYAIAGMGGYVSFPVVFIGKMLRKRIIIHEQNLLPGLANRMIQYFANKVAVSFEESKKYFRNEKLYRIFRKECLEFGIKLGCQYFIWRYN